MAFLDCGLAKSGSFLPLILMQMNFLFMKLTSEVMFINSLLINGDRLSPLSQPNLILGRKTQHEP
jgi:hypothetical protein